MKVSGLHNALAALPPRKEPQYPLTRWPSGPRAGLNVLKRREEPLVLGGIQTADHPTCNTVTVPTIQTPKVRYKIYKNDYQFLWQIFVLKWSQNYKLKWMLKHAVSVT
jgi:hypothetical protein